ncbi:hypothetical protein DPMN_107370 [Dreissena polymorpha]|uniref:Reverse transcriptase domain-containing protein n=1 Tax=Dreissena polymorpha TaxID=45954 RepID=A0A9D4K6L3_DREPO|nr:hypothetical protein DPMN_107370 [Dreissena polymorpha]
MRSYLRASKLYLRYLTMNNRAIMEGATSLTPTSIAFSTKPAKGNRSRYASNKGPKTTGILVYIVSLHIYQTSLAAVSIPDIWETPTVWVIVKQETGTKRATTTQSHSLAKAVVKQMKSQHDLAILDLSKVFDNVPHQRRLTKLHHHGILKETWELIRAFLVDRRHSTIWNLYYKDHIYDLEMVQIIAARYVTNQYHITSSVSSTTNRIQ